MFTKYTTATVVELANRIHEMGFPITVAPNDVYTVGNKGNDSVEIQVSGNIFTLRNPLRGERVGDEIQLYISWEGGLVLVLSDKHKLSGGKFVAMK